MIQVIVHHCDGECSTEGEFEVLSDALYYAEKRAKDLAARHEWIYVGGHTIQGQKEEKDEEGTCPIIAQTRYR